MKVAGAVLVGLGVASLLWAGFTCALLGGHRFAVIDQIVLCLLVGGLGTTAIGGAMLTAKR